MPLKHTKRTDYLRKQRRNKCPKDAKFKVPVTRRDILDKPEKEQTIIDEFKAKKT